MLEHIARPVYYLEVHLLFASLVWVAAWLLTWAGPGSATTKYWIWVATALNFVLPLGAVVDKSWASHLSWATPIGLVGEAGLTVARSASVAGAVWLVGATLMLTRLYLGLRAERRHSRPTASQSPLEPRLSIRARGVPVRISPIQQVPAVDGVLRPRISLPQGIDRVLSERELTAVLIHEGTHARRRDNLIRLIHELGLCALWFHPLVWLTGSRLALYRELSCDESVIHSGHDRDLVSALAKLATPADGFLLQATASSFIPHRLARLTQARPRRTQLAASAVTTVVFGAVLLGGLLATVEHTACCFAVHG